MTMYESPIRIFEKQMRTEIENNIFKAVQEYGISIDRDELIRVLNNDRNQYERGYADGCQAARDEWISIDERLPSMDELCLLSMENRITKYRWVVIGYYHTNYDEYVTHWMPLPEPPMMKGGAEK